MSNDVNQGPIDYQHVLADLRKRRNELDVAIAALESISGQTSSQAVSDLGGGGDPGNIREDAFFNMSILEGAKKFLRMAKKPKSPAEIAEALEKGGMTHTSVNWINTVGSVLYRDDKAHGEIMSYTRGKYGLAEWYPGRRRTGKRGNEDGQPDASKDA